MKKLITIILKKLGYNLIKISKIDPKTTDTIPNPIAEFNSFHYIRHNQRRQEHLACLNLHFYNKTVLEVGAGIGDHTTFWLDRNCEVTITEARDENIEILKTRFPNEEIIKLDLDSDFKIDFKEKFDIVYCYGTLYHLKDPESAIKYLAQNCGGVLLLETCVSFGNQKEINLVHERGNVYSQAIHGTGCRPTRPWVFEELKKHFNFVYMPTSQPAHPEFPLDWSKDNDESLSRSIFIGSIDKIENKLLVEYIPELQDLI